MVAERGEWAQQLTVAHKLYQEGNWQRALFTFSQLAAIGFETAQYNAAFILSNAKMQWRIFDPFLNSSSPSSISSTQSPVSDHESNGDSDGSSTILANSGSRSSSEAGESSDAKKSVPATVSVLNSTASANQALLAWKEVSAMNKTDKERLIRVESEKRALALHALSADQGNSLSLLALGDYHYYQRAGLLLSQSDAVLYYQQAADNKLTQAIFNLGLMYEIGDGVTQDFHLAKR